MRVKTHAQFRWVLVGFVCLLGWWRGAAQNIETGPKDPTVAAGKPVILLFVRTDCPISNRYAPTIQNLAGKYAGRVVVWLVYPSKSDTEQVIASKRTEYGYNLPWIRDPDHVLVKKSNATITPEAALFDTSGQLRYHGRIDDLYVTFGRARRSPTTHELDDAIAAVLAGKPVSNDAAPAVGCYISDLK